MNRIPLSPIGMEPEKPRRRQSIFSKLWRGVRWFGSTPALWLGMKTIRQGASLIGDLTSRMRGRPKRDPRFRTEEQRVFDLRATAFSYGITVAELERRLSARRRQTALTAYGLAGLGLLFFGAWLIQVLAAEGSGRRLLLAINFLPLCLLFALLAFYQALINFQIRAGRAASWREYLMTDSGFWPRP